MNFKNKKQAKNAKLRSNIRRELEVKKCSTNFLKILDRQNM